MKRTTLVIAVALIGSSVASAQWAVFDGSNLRQSITNYAALTEQLARQATQISNQMQQIRHMETQLLRKGDMAAIRAVVGFPEFRADIRFPSQIRTWDDRLGRVDGRDIFGDTRGGIYPVIAIDFPDFDGHRIEREPFVFREAHNIVLTVDDFRTVQTNVYARRENLRRAIARTSEAMQGATTEAEHEKLRAVLSAQYEQLAAVDAEVLLSAANVQAKAAESAAMHDAHEAAAAESRRRLAQQEATKVTSTFKPQYECMLQYVTERPLSR